MAALYYYYHIGRAARFRALASSILHPQIFQFPANLFHAAFPNSFLAPLVPRLSTYRLASVLADYNIFSLYDFPRYS